MKLDVFLPSLLVSPDWFADSAAPRLTAIEALLTCGRLRIGGEWPNVLLPAFGTDGSQGIAAFSALGDALVTGISGWMFAEPAHFQADRDTLNLLPSSHLDITANEAAQLIDALNANFADRGLAFACGISGQWYVCCTADELPKTRPISAVRRGSMFENLPQSRGKLSWKAIQNETQMLFFSHAINEAREAAGKLTINGLWFWGEGIVPTTPIGWKPAIGAVFGESPLTNGLAKWAKTQFAPIGQMTLADIVPHADYNLLVINALEISHERGEIDVWRETAFRLESQLFVPLLASLRAGSIDEVIVTLPRDHDSLVVSIDAKSLRGISGWWKNLTRKPRPFTEFALA